MQIREEIDALFFTEETAQRFGEKALTLFPDRFDCFKINKQFHRGQFIGYAVVCRHRDGDDKPLSEETARRLR